MKIIFRSGEICEFFHNSSFGLRYLQNTNLIKTPKFSPFFSSFFFLFFFFHMVVVVGSYEGVSSLIYAHLPISLSDCFQLGGGGKGGRGNTYRSYNQ